MTISLRPRTAITPTKRSASWLVPAAAATSPAKKSDKGVAIAVRRRISAVGLRDVRSAPVLFMHEFVRYYNDRVVSSVASAAKKTITKTPMKTKTTTTAPSRAVHVRAHSKKDADNDDDDRRAKDPNDQGVFHYPAKLRPLSVDARVEIAFSFDTTGSMSSYITTVKREVNRIVTQLTADVPDLRIGIIAHGDYCDSSTYILKRLDLSNDAREIENFVQGVTMTSGGDGDECYEFVLHDAQSFSWTATSTKILVVIGDAAPHRPDQYRRINWRDELRVLKGMDVRVYGIRCGHETAFYETIATETGGKTLELANIHQITPLMLELCYREAANLHVEGGNGPAVDLDHAPALVLTDVERQDHLAVHGAIHSHEGSVALPSSGARHDISVGNFGCRFVRIGETTYIEQNKEEGSRYAHMANEGKFITWMVSRGKWACIFNNTITSAEPEITPTLPPTHA